MEMRLLNQYTGLSREIGVQDDQFKFCCVEMSRSDDSNFAGLRSLQAVEVVLRIHLR